MVNFLIEEMESTYHHNKANPLPGEAVTCVGALGRPEDHDVEIELCKILGFSILK